MSRTAASLTHLSDGKLLEAVQRQTFAFFWDGAEKASYLARDRCTTKAVPANDLVAVGGSGFGIMALIVAVERGWVSRGAAAARLARMLVFWRAPPAITAPCRISCMARPASPSLSAARMTAAIWWKLPF